MSNYESCQQLILSKMPFIDYHTGRSSDLLRLPPEIRRLIYSYLLPTLDIDPGKIRYGRGALREDGKSGGGLLQVNRQIHNEIYNDWYSNTMYIVQIASNGGVMFLNHFIFRPDESMPSTLMVVKELYVDIHIGRLGDQTMLCDISKLGRLLSTNRSLKNLYVGINIHPGHIYFEDMSSQMIHDQVLELHLYPLRSMRGLSEVPIGPTTASKLSHYHGTGPLLFNLEVVALEHLDHDQSKEAMLPVLGEEPAEDDASASYQQLSIRSH